MQYSIETSAVWGWLNRWACADAAGATTRSGARHAPTRRRWATRRRWRWGGAAARARCPRRRRRRVCRTGTSRARGTLTPTRTTGASGAAARARSGTCARRTPYDAPASAPRLERSRFILGDRVYIDDSRCSAVRTSLPARRGPPPNSSIYEVLENLIFNSLKFYSLICITVRAIEVWDGAGRIVCARIFT